MSSFYMLRPNLGNTEEKDDIQLKKRVAHVNFDPSTCTLYVKVLAKANIGKEQFLNKHMKYFVQRLIDTCPKQTSINYLELDGIMLAQELRLPLKLNGLIL